jgi:hypothetical protein
LFLVSLAGKFSGRLAIDGLNYQRSGADANCAKME